jgi:hypothetical protein
MIAKVRHEEFEEVNRNIEQLISLAQTDDEIKLVSMMKIIVPEYISNSSKFEALDSSKTRAAPKGAA